MRATESIGLRVRLVLPVTYTYRIPRVQHERWTRFFVSIECGSRDASYGAVVLVVVLLPSTNAQMHYIRSDIAVTVIQSRGVVRDHN